MSKNLSGIDLIAQERKRQIEAEGWTAEHDAIHGLQELAFAAITYAMPFERVHVGTTIKRIHFWPFSPDWWKPTPDDRIRELAKAGALIAAEIDRLQNLSK